MNKPDEFGKCATCRKPLNSSGTLLCNGCWGMECGLEYYLRDGGERARRFVSDALEKAKEEAIRAKLIKEVSDTIPDREDEEMGGEAEHIRAVTLDGVVRLLRDVDLS